MKAHDLRVQTWGAPTAIPAGQSFEVHVGIACSSGCALPGQAFEIVDEAGAAQTSGAVGDETWKSTKALYFATVGLTAPEEHGYFEWRVKTLETDLELPHDGGVARFGLNAVPAPEHTVRVTAIDKDTGEPIEGIHVWLHPFRAVTDAEGVADVVVPDGTYRLYVSGLRYFPHDTQVDITDDLETTVELTWEERPEKIR